MSFNHLQQLWPEIRGGKHITHPHRLQAEAETWQEAVKIGVDLLVAADVVEPRYYQAILDGVAQHGPYFVLFRPPVRHG